MSNKTTMKDKIQMGLIAGGIMALFGAIITPIGMALEEEQIKPAQAHCDKFAEQVKTWNEAFTEEYADEEVHANVYNRYMRENVCKYFGIVEDAE